MPFNARHGNRYSGLARFVAPARGEASPWRSLAGLAMIVAGHLVMSWVLLGVLARGLPGGQGQALIAEAANGSTPRGVVLVLASFAPLLIATLAVIRFWHGRGIASVLGPGWLRDFLKVLPFLAGVSLLGGVVTLFSPDIGQINPLWRVLLWLPVVAPFIALQVAAEEILFRGYLLQQLAALWPDRRIWMIAPSALFGLLHYAPESFGTGAPWIALWAALFGLLAADLTARSGNLGAALALHLVNNLSSLLLLGFYGDLDGLSLYAIVINTRDLAALAPWLAADALILGIGWLAIRIMLRV